MSIRFVIPTEAKQNDRAWPHRPETWLELAKEAEEEVIIENLGSQWCLDNGIDGLGFCTENSGSISMMNGGN